MRPVQLLLLAAAALIGVAHAGQGYLFPQSACRVRCENGGACAYDTADPSIHSCICLVGVYEGERCERLVPGAVDPAAVATTTTTTTTTTTPATTTPSAYELERRRHEAQRLRIMEERRKHEEERQRLEEERRRLVEERARQEEARRVEMETRGREDEARRKKMQEDEHRRRVDEDRRRDEEHRRKAEEERRVADERRRAEEGRRAAAAEEEERKRQQQEEAAERGDDQQKLESDDSFEPTHKLDYDDYEDSLDGERMEEVPDDKNTVDEDEDIDRVESGEMEKPEEEEDDDEEEETTVTTPEPTKAVTYEVTEDDYVTTTTPTLEQEQKDNKEDDGAFSNEDDYWDHTPEDPDREADGTKRYDPLPGAGSTEEVVMSGTQVDQTGRAVGVSQLEDEMEEQVEKDGEDGWMMVKRKQTASASSHFALTTFAAAFLTARWLL